MISLVISLAVVSADPTLDLTTLAKVVDGLQADLKDVEFVYEGRMRKLVQVGSDYPERSFQGEFAYRSDGSIATDLYTRKADPQTSLRRQVFCLSERSRVEELDYYPDLPLQATRLKKLQGGVPTVNQIGAPNRYISMPMFLEYLLDRGGYRSNNGRVYEFLGWEDVAGARCVKVQFVTKPDSPLLPVLQDIYWLDLNRSGNILKHEYRNRGVLLTSVGQVVLSAYKVGSNLQFWYPISGVVRSYISGKQRPDGTFETLGEDKPIIEEEYSIVDEAPRFNRDLPNERFKVDFVKSAATALRAARTEVESSLRRPTQKAATRVNQAVQQADGQKVELEASAPSREWFSATTVGMVVLGFVGVGLLAGAVVLRGRAG